MAIIKHALSMAFTHYSEREAHGASSGEIIEKYN